MSIFGILKERFFNPFEDLYNDSFSKDEYPEDVGFLLMEDGFFLLQENDAKIVLDK
jgi:hypothetical protein